MATLKTELAKPAYTNKTPAEILGILNAPTGTEAVPLPSIAESLDDFHRTLELHDVVWAKEVHGNG